MMLLYSLALIALGVLGLPWWIARLRRSPAEKAALRERLGAVPKTLKDDAGRFRNVWLHAVSVGEVIAASRLIPELTLALEAAAPSLGASPTPWRVAISTTTVTGQQLARERFGSDRVFFNPVDLARPVRAYLDTLRPAALLLMEGELWPRLLDECQGRRIPVAVVNARVSDRSFERTLPLRRLWRRVLGGRVALWCAQSRTDAERLAALGAPPDTIHSTGNLKYDVRAPQHSAVAAKLQQANAGRPLIVCGSTTGDREQAEEALLLRETLPQVWAARPDTLVVLAPRHPERFDEAFALAVELAGPALLASAWLRADVAQRATANEQRPAPITARVLVLDTIGDLAALYALADAAFIGGSLLPRGGHNPLEPAQFGVPIVTGPSEENFRDVTAALRDAGGLFTGETAADCGQLLANLLARPDLRAEAGQHAREAFVRQGGATARTIAQLVPLILAATAGRQAAGGAQ